MSKLNRRDFIRAAGAAGVVAAAGNLDAFASQTPKQKGKTVAGLRTKQDRVRVAFIGVGARGPGHLSDLMAIEGVEVKAICDTHKPSLDRAVKMATDKGFKVDAYGKDDYDYRNMLDRNDIDAVWIATPWEWHAKMAVDALNRGKHAFVEVPLALTIEEMWSIVDAAEKNQKHCMMLENVNYGREELMVLNMCRKGVFGELLHGEAAYIHDLRGQMHEIEHGTGSWRTLHYAKRNGNLYPTHGLGPVAQYMNINRGDRFDYLSSVSSPSRSRAIYAREKFPEGHSRRKLNFVCGDINTTIIKTLRGKSIMVQWDEQLPRPYNRLNLIQGTRGIWGGFPDRVVIEGRSKSTHSWEQGQDLEAYYKDFEHPLWKAIGDDAKKHGGHGGMDFVMNWRIIYCLRNGEPLDQDVYDGAAWSAISPLSEWSVANRSQSIDVPDFTRGMWKSMEPLGIVGG
ncbi:MAG TPA: Gfo/Idh/MocA family oxidoreductase [Fimbriimonadaceae bacterium]|nr:Gfo/Idh/MocA family oxidoreductase [Fimbriimonadaceae bacterium]